MKNLIRLILMVVLIILASKVLTSDFKIIKNQADNEISVTYP